MICFKPMAAGLRIRVMPSPIKEKNRACKTSLNTRDSLKVEVERKYPDIKTNFLTVDGVHMGPFGNMMMAKAILKSFGLNDSEMAKAGAEWMKLKWNIRGIGNFTVKEYCTLEEKLWSQKKTISSYINEKLRELLK